MKSAEWERVGADWHFTNPKTGCFAKISGSERSRFRIEIDGTRVSRRYHTHEHAKVAAEKIAATPNNPPPMYGVDAAWRDFVAEDKGGHSAEDLLEIGFRAGWKAGRGE